MFATVFQGIFFSATVLHWNLDEFTIWSKPLWDSRAQQGAWKRYNPGQKRRKKERLREEREDWRLSLRKFFHTIINFFFLNYTNNFLAILINCSYLTTEHLWEVEKCPNELMEHPSSFIFLTEPVALPLRLTSIIVIYSQFKITNINSNISRKKFIRIPTTNKVAL